MTKHFDQVAVYLKMCILWCMCNKQCEKVCVCVCVCVCNGMCLDYDYFTLTLIL